MDEATADEIRKAKNAERARKWRAANPERAREIQRQWILNNPEAAKAKRAKYRAKKPAAEAAYVRAFIESGRAAQQRREWRAANPERERENQRRWREANREKVAAKYQRWRLTHLDQEADRQRRREALKLTTAVTTISPEMLAAKFAYWGNRCWMCGTTASQVDHVKPLTKGGAHILANLRPACISCNSRKHNRWYGVAVLSMFTV